MELSKEQVQTILNDAKPSIIEGLKKEVISQAKWQMSPIVSSMIQEEVKKFMNEEIIPVIKTNLIENKEGLISTAITISNGLTEELGKALSQTLKEKLERSYERTNLLKALFS